MTLSHAFFANTGKIKLTDCEGNGRVICHFDFSTDNVSVLDKQILFCH